MPFSARAVANYLRTTAIRDGRTLNSTQIQTLVYCAHACHLVLYQEPLIYEFFEAWPEGPIIADIHDEGARSWPLDDGWGGSSRRPDRSQDQRVLEDEPTSPSFRIQAQRLLDYIRDNSKNHEDEIFLMTRGVNSPWAQVRQAHAGQSKVPIPNELIRQRAKRMTALLFPDADGRSEG